MFNGSNSYGSSAASVSMGDANSAIGSERSCPGDARMFPGNATSALTECQSRLGE